MGVTLPKTEVTQNYALFLFAGQLPWLLFSDTVQRSASSVLEQGSLITKTVFPAEMIPISVFLSTLVGHLLGLLAVGLGWIVASLHVFLRDTAQVVSVILTFWFSVTPIPISEQRFPAWARQSALLRRSRLP